MRFSLNHLLDISELRLQSLTNQIGEMHIERIIRLQQSWQWIVYLIEPILILLKIAIISLVLDLGCFFFNKDIKYKKLFNIVVKAEFVFILVIVFKTIWFYFFKTDYTLEDVQYFYPLSSLNIVGYEGIKSWLIYSFSGIKLV